MIFADEETNKFYVIISMYNDPAIFLQLTNQFAPLLERRDLNMNEDDDHDDDTTYLLTYLRILHFFKTSNNNN
jgi:hypothetical protein